MPLLWTPATRRVGICSASAVLALSVVYMMTGALGLKSGYIVATLGDPYRAVLEAIIVIIAPFAVALLVAVNAYSPDDRKVFSFLALTFMGLSMGVTSSIHFVELTVARRLGHVAAGQLSSLLEFRWPSVAFGLDLFAWDFLFGLSLLLAAPVFQGDRLHRAVRVCLSVGGGLCLAGTLGPVLGDLRLQWLAIVGYAGVFPLASLLLAILFLRSKSSESFHGEGA